MDLGRASSGMEDYSKVRRNFGRGVTLLFAMLSFSVGLRRRAGVFVMISSSTGPRSAAFELMARLAATR